MGKDKEKKEKKASMSEEPVVTFVPVETIDETPAAPVKKAKKKTARVSAHHEVPHMRQ